MGCSVLRCSATGRIQPITARMLPFYWFSVLALVGVTICGQASAQVPAARSNVFDGEYYSVEFAFGFRITGENGIATVSNSPLYEVGQVMLRFIPTGPSSFRGEQLCTDGVFHSVTARLNAAGNLVMAIEDCGAVQYTMIRDGSTAIPQAARVGPFDGTYFSAEFLFGFRISGDRGMATVTNSPRYQVDDTMLRFAVTGPHSFEGEQLCTDGEFHPVSATLDSAGGLDMVIEGCTPNRYNMVRVGAAADAPDNGTEDPAVWVGAPFAGNWPSATDCAQAEYPSMDCSLPAKHWTPYGGDWSADMPQSAGTKIHLYLAPDVTARTVRAKVEAVTNACTSGDGGKVVTIGVYFGDRKIGWVKYAHVVPSVEAGTEVAPWGSNLGSVFGADADQENCWYGPHVHMEFDNTNNYSCYSKGWSAGQKVSASAFVGFLGGSRVKSQPAPCP